MVGNDTERNIFLCVGVILNACKPYDVLHNILNRVNLKDVIDILHYAGKAFKSHACVNVFIFKLCVVSLAVVVELAEYEVPDFNYPVAVACLLEAFKRSVSLATVKVYLRTRTAGS